MRSGESYGIMNSMMTHFGLGTNSSITKIVVKWPSGTVDELFNPNINESITIVEGITLSTNETSESKFKVYPNPTRGNITIEGLQSSANVNYELYDITGKIVQTKTLLSSTNMNVNISHLQSGIYFLNLYENNKRYVHKVVKD